MDRYLKGRPPIGHEADLKFTGVRDSPRPMAFVPYTQATGISTMTVELRTTGDAASILRQARATLRDLGPDLVPLQPMSQQQQFEESYADDRLFARLAVSFGALAALLVTTGLFGTLAYRVNRRIPEIGVRMAPGARRPQVLWMVLRESLALALVGAAAGVPLAIAASRLLGSMLFNLAPGDPASFAAALAGIAVVTLAATVVPARRAAAVDPMIAPRED